ncbi:MAG: acyl-CoA thioesterase [Chloroflexi bacterium]|nr:MAG: acyl-CoA thioesterase [Chloroflexota bacterium]
MTGSQTNTEVIMSDDLFRFSTVLEVRWRDLDALGHVNNAVYFTYLEQTRVHYLRQLGLAPSDPASIGIILAETGCQFKSPVGLGERVTVYARVSELRNSSFVFEYRMEVEDGRLAALARSVQVCYDYQARRSVPIPDDWREAIVAYEPGLRPNHS